MDCFVKPYARSYKARIDFPPIIYKRRKKELLSNMAVLEQQNKKRLCAMKFEEFVWAMFV